MGAHEFKARVKQRLLISNEAAHLVQCDVGAAYMRHTFAEPWMEMAHFHFHFPLPIGYGLACLSKPERRMGSSRMLRRVILVRTEVSVQLELFLVH
jgi:hypothetical protein